jgi:methyltransferase family protein
VPLATEAVGNDGGVRFFDSADEVRRAREAFDAGGYTLAAITERLGPHVFSHLSAGEQAPLLRASRGGDRLDVLARLFLVGAPVPVADARATLAPLPLERWQAGGVVAVDGDQVAALLAIRPLGEPREWLVAHDRPRPDGTLRPDHVIGIGASTVALAGTTIRRTIDAALDLGTGCGIQALNAADHSRRVVATDLNPRAVACATLTVELNGITSVSVRHGDLFEPVADETFDLVVANPPFVISPAQRYLFRDSGRPLDGVSRAIVEQVPRLLRDGGHCQLLASWAHLRGEDWRERLAAWFAGSGCDALVLQREALEPAAHAASWLRQTERAADWGEFDDWVDYYDECGVEAIGFGLITMRKRGDGRTPWFRAEVAEQDFALPCGDHLGATFELAELVRTSDDGDLLATAFGTAPDVVLDERRRPAPGGWVALDRRLRQTAGLCREGEVDDVVAAIVAGCDGQRPLADVLDAVATGCGGDAAEVRSSAMPIVRRLIEQAFLLPAVPG